MKSKLMLIYMDETSSAGEIPLYQAVVQKLLQLQVGGATVHIGEMGFGNHHRLHRKGLFGISDERPVMISVVESEEKLREVLPDIRQLARDAVILILDAEMV